ncbi:MAG: hypothetical protein LW823_03320 [Rickettsiales bacterium]|nr:hypothetical protein [Rickettsiales bacterium]
MLPMTANAASLVVGGDAPASGIKVYQKKPCVNQGQTCTGHVSTDNNQTANNTTQVFRGIASSLEDCVRQCHAALENYFVEIGLGRITVQQAQGLGYTSNCGLRYDRCSAGELPFDILYGTEKRYGTPDAEGNVVLVDEEGVALSQ